MRGGAPGRADAAHCVRISTAWSSFPAMKGSCSRSRRWRTRRMPTALTGDRIRAVRRLFGFSQAENGTREALEELLKAIAEATTTLRSFFEVMPPDIPLGTLRFRKLAP